MSTKEQIEEYKKLKLYIVVKDSIPLGKAVVAIAHAPLIANFEWGEMGEGTSRRDYISWIDHSFKKVVCRCTEEQFDSLKFWRNDVVVVTESTLDNAEVAIVVRPSMEQNKKLKGLLQGLKLYA